MPVSVLRVDDRRLVDFSLVAQLFGVGARYWLRHRGKSHAALVIIERTVVNAVRHVLQQADFRSRSAA